MMDKQEFYFEKFMQDLDNRVEDEKLRKQKLNELEKMHQTRHRNRLYRELPSNLTYVGKDHK